MIREKGNKALHLLAAFILVAACTSNKEENKDGSGMEMHQQQMSETYVDTMVLHQKEFNKQIVCNGRLRAKAKSELNFNGQGIIAEVFVREGQHISKGKLIATLDKQDRQRELEKAEHELQRAKVELTDKLISLGYNDMNAVPADVIERAEVMSGYYSAKFQLQSAKKALEECNLYAPFSGRIADLEAKRFQKNDKVCTLVDDSDFEVEFRILEAELLGVRIGQKVKVTPFVQDSIQYEGRVTEINPLVDDKGLVKIKAQLSNRGNTLLDGMNVRVIVEEKMQHMFVVPKDAVVERDGYQVIFLLEEGRAVWTYVDVVHSNISSFAITGCQRKETTIKEGDIVITSGNLNLADGTEVIVNVN
ncbi:MAG: efflux RND transporter periplasmic adaptor subunit [Bacteroidaceae bacterium]|nr:efflux RND transporter periplasmic adaptor subunit [Bacteroidaceae bacterium]